MNMIMFIFCFYNFGEEESYNNNNNISQDWKAGGGSCERWLQRKAVPALGSSLRGQWRGGGQEWEAGPTSTLETSSHVSLFPRPFVTFSSVNASMHLTRTHPDHGITVHTHTRGLRATTACVVHRANRVMLCIWIEWYEPTDTVRGGKLVWKFPWISLQLSSLDLV